MRSTLLNELVNRQYTITKQTDNILEGRKPANNFAANFLLGTAYDPNVMVRTTFVIIPMENATRVVGDIALISNSGSAYERVTPINNSQSSMEMQSALDNIAP